MTLEPETASIRAARLFATRLLDLIDSLPADDPRLVSDVALLVSELVSNAVEHSDGQVTVRLSAENGGLRVEVEDCVQGAPVLHEVPWSAPAGRGLAIVDHVAADWGAADNADGKTVWFRLEP